MSSSSRNVSNLSKHTMEMKFMQRSAMKLETDRNEEDHRRMITDEHWVLDIPHLKEKESPFIMEPSYVKCEDLTCYTRFSYKGANKDIERIMNSYKAEEEVDKSMEADVEDEELADKLSANIADKFKTKKDRKRSPDEIPDEAPKAKDSKQSSSEHSTKKKKKFLKPSDD